jgi:hypothetical protein
VAQVVRPRTADFERAGGPPHRLLEGSPVVEVAARERAADPQPLDGALEADAAARRTGAGAEVDDVVSDGDRCPSRLKRMRSMALASVAVPTVERGSEPIRCWSTMMAVVSPSSTSTSGRANVGMKPCTKAL